MICSYVQDQKIIWVMIGHLIQAHKSGLKVNVHKNKVMISREEEVLMCEISVSESHLEHFLEF